MTQPDTAADPRLAEVYASHFAAQGRVDALVSTALRADSVAVREVLSFLITKSPDWRALTRSARDEPTELRRSLEESDGVALCALARLVGLQRAGTEDAEQAVRLFRVARMLRPIDRWGSQDVRTYAQLLWELELLDELAAHEVVAAFPADERAFLRADIESAKNGVGTPGWLAIVNEHLAEQGLLPISVDRGATVAFDRLSTPVLADPVDGPLVSVIMSAYRPGAEIIPAVDSILRQSWRNLELLVVDDASGPEYDHVFDAVARRDARIRVLRAPENRGTYAARNRAIDALNGEFVTFQDSDDWSHPQRVERQVTPMLDDSDVHSTLSRSIRCLPDITFQYLGQTTSRKNASSLMFRRSVLSTVGYFDPVRKSADSEFIDRLRAAIPGRQVTMTDQLAFVRLAAQSLSRADFRPGWQHPARHEYRAAYYEWHRRIVSGGATPWMPKEINSRPFRAPFPLLERTGFAKADDRTFDVVFVNDWRPPPRESKRSTAQAHRRLLGDAAELTRMGLRVGLLASERLDNAISWNADIHRTLRAAVSDGQLDVVLPTDQSRARTLVICDPAAMMYPPARSFDLRVDRVVVLADRQPGKDGIGSDAYAVAACEDAVNHLFGQRPLWLPVDERVASSLAQDVEPQRVLAAALLGEPDPDSWRSPLRRRAHSRTVIGTCASGPMSFPLNDRVMRAVYGHGAKDAFDVRLLAPDGTLGRGAPDVLPDWLVYRDEDLSMREFLAQLDFYLAFPESPRADDYKSALEAAASGCVVVASHAVAAALGDAVVACDARDVRTVITELWADRERYSMLSAGGPDRARAMVMSVSELATEWRGLAGTARGATAKSTVR